MFSIKFAIIISAMDSTDFPQDAHPLRRCSCIKITLLQLIHFQINFGCILVLILFFIYIHLSFSLMRSHTMGFSVFNDTFVSLILVPIMARLMQNYSALKYFNDIALTNDNYIISLKGFQMQVLLFALCCDIRSWIGIIPRCES